MKLGTLSHLPSGLPVLRRGQMLLTAHWLGALCKPWQPLEECLGKNEG